MSGTTSAGEILGTLRLSITDFETNIAKAQALADKLDGKNVSVTVKVDTAGAETKLAAVAASEDKVSKSSGGATGGLASVESAARRLADASSVANIAQLRLSEVQGSGTAKASSLASAHQSVTKAQRDLSDLMKSSTPEVVRIAEAMKQVDAEDTKVAKSSKEASNGLGLMSMAIVGLGPAIVPLAAGAAGLAVGFGAMGAAGILAIVGISREMKAGTPLGGAYTTMVGTLSGDLTTLGHTAAAGVLGPFQQEVATLQGQMPALNGIIGEFSVITGKTAGNLMNGLVAAFIALEPLARDVGVYVLDLSSKFAAMMSGPGVVSFGDYIRSVFPQVMQTVESVVTAAVHLVAALAPFGSGALSELKMFSDIIAAIPVNVLTVLASGAASVYIGFKSFSLLSTGITAVGVALKAVGMSAETAATGMLALNIAAGAIGILITIATLAFSAHASAVQGDQDAVNSLTDALIANNGAIGANTVAEQANKLAKDGTLAAAKLLGYAVGDVTNASLGNADAMARVTAHTNDLVTAYGGVAPAALKTGASLDDGINAFNLVSDATKNGAKNLGLATQAYDAITTATKTSTTAAGTMTTATLLGMNAQQQSESTNKSQVATIKTLNAAMDEELSRELNLAGATSNLDQATLTMTETLKKNKLTMDGHTQAGIDDRRAIEGVVGSLQAQRDANIKAGDSTAVATGKYSAASAALLDQTGKMYGTTSQAYKYMKQLLAIPANVKTQVDAATEAAKTKIWNLQAQIDALHGKSVAVSVAANFHVGTGASLLNTSNVANKLAAGGSGYAGGGQIAGPGTGTSDSIPFWGSNGEFIVNAKATAKNLPLLHAINGGGQGFGTLGLLAGLPQALAAGGPLPLPACISPHSQLTQLRKVLS